MSFVKYRLKEVATDFGTTPKAVADIISRYYEKPKSNTQVLTDQELNAVFDYMTQHNQIDSIEQVFAVKAAPKAEAPKQEAPKPAAPQQNQPARQDRPQGQQPRQDRPQQPRQDRPRASSRAVPSRASSSIITVLSSSPSSSPRPRPPRPRSPSASASAAWSIPPLFR